MVPSRARLTWLIAVGTAVAFAIGISAEQATSVGSQGVVTPLDPIFGVQDPAPAPTPEPDDQESPAPARGGRAGGGGRGQAPRPYAEVMKGARTDEGIFKVHRVNDSVLYEIPKAQLNKDFLWVTQIKRTTFGAGYGGQAVDDRVVRWELNNNRVFLRQINYSVVADAATPIAQAVQDANTPAIVRPFNVAAFSPQSGQLPAGFALRDGDTVTIPKAETIFVTGQVKIPGPYVIEGDLTVMQAIAMAGGATDKGAPNRVRIFRTVDGKQQEIRGVKLSDLVKAGDTIDVPQRYF